MGSETLAIDGNDKGTVGFVTDDANQYIRRARIDDATKGLKVMIVGGSVGSGTVTNVSVVPANGFSGTVATSTTTPAITLSTTITGLLQGNGTAISAVTIGTGLSFTGGILSATGTGGTPGGLNTQLQYNNTGVLGGITGAVTDGTSVSLTGAHLLSPTINGAGAGLATLAYPNTASSATITFPVVTGTLATLAGSETLTK
jgi:hypothetical protein